MGRFLAELENCVYNNNCFNAIISTDAGTFTATYTPESVNEGNEDIEISVGDSFIWINKASQFEYDEVIDNYYIINGNSNITIWFD